ncbi:MAG: NAD(P)H-hydrate dehydratase [Elusimicrobiota bacterium]
MTRPVAPKLREFLTPREPADHKGTFGHVLIAAGSRGMAGAAIFAARAAAKSGAGLVTLALPRSLQASVAAQVPEALTLGLPENQAGAFAAGAGAALIRFVRQKQCTVLAIGPGISTTRETRAFLVKTLERIRLPLALDADALNILSGLDARAVKRLLSGRPGVIATPHPGEMARCLKIGADWIGYHRIQAALTLAQNWGCTALLKGRGTVVSDGRRAWINPTGTTALAKGGSGDILTGLIAGLWAQRLASGRGTGDAALQSALVGAWLHGKAGEMAEKKYTAWAAITSAIIDELPAAFHQLCAGNH